MKHISFFLISLFSLALLVSCEGVPSSMDTTRQMLQGQWVVTGRVYTSNAGDGTMVTATHKPDVKTTYKFSADSVVISYKDTTVDTALYVLTKTGNAYSLLIEGRFDKKSAVEAHHEGNSLITIRQLSFNKMEWDYEYFGGDEGPNYCHVYLEKDKGQLDEMISEIIKPGKLNLSAREQELKESVNAFSWAFLSQVCANESESDVLLSPLSASMLMGMLMNGSAGDTYTQIQNTLGFSGMSQDEINLFYKKLMICLPTLDESNIIRLANALWISDRFPVKMPFVLSNQNAFDAEVENVNFLDEAIVGHINQWAADHTNDLITEVVDNTICDYSTAMVLANALYFKGIWAKQFDPKNTFPATFYNPKQKMEVEMMQKHDTVGYCEFAGGSMVELDYREGQYCMDILLPDKESNVDALINSMTDAKWNNILSQVVSQEVFVKIPKFRLRYERELNEDLAALGIRDVLTPMADMSPLSDIPTFLSLVKQFTYMQVDEEGTEAAAVTIGVVKTTSVGPQYSFIADRPFVLVIREKQYGTVLFMAKITAPENK